MHVGVLMCPQRGHLLSELMFDSAWHPLTVSCGPLAQLATTRPPH